MPHLHTFIIEERAWGHFHHQPPVDTRPYLHNFLSRLKFTSALSSLKLSTSCNANRGPSSIPSFFTTHFDSLDTLTTLSLQYNYLRKDEFVLLLEKLGPGVPSLTDLKLYASSLTFPEREWEDPPYARFWPSVLERFYVQSCSKSLYPQKKPWFPSLEKFTCILGTSWEEFDDRDLLEFLADRLSKPSGSLPSHTAVDRRLKMVDIKFVSFKNIDVWGELKARGVDTNGFELAIMYGQDSLWHDEHLIWGDDLDD
ncbi:hypothetical protein CC1G_15755 [Coprinopsis cinerea okayama7|uniref:F-box domain-containing protein n=1 Tax=Coprinopsis cinerea (strain Okayama-7 / 130 / ATCC MYA-4618 / FGSC 9003) TaxID=240176 RepID=D6RR14_COPC7|nr:hypothetical protein CC1G_15755 [Coprinopsis cinerea okayama7\|eukprot:XP_002910036.1 hypothetical protein CC1G_15755 [Coprinopsis cinerea okayama7\